MDYIADKEDLEQNSSCRLEDKSIIHCTTEIVTCSPEVYSQTLKEIRVINFFSLGTSSKIPDFFATLDSLQNPEKVVLPIMQMLCSRSIQITRIMLETWLN